MSLKIAIVAVALAGLHACSGTDFASSGETPPARSKDANGKAGSDASDGADATDGDVIENDDEQNPSGGGGEDEGEGDLGEDEDQADGGADDLGASDSEAEDDGGIKTDEDELNVEKIEQVVQIPAGGNVTINGASKPGFIPQLQALAAGEFNSRFSGGHGLRNDPTTATEACKKMGFLEGRAIAASNWSAPYNETMWFFSGTWQFVKSKSSDKNHINTLECKQTCTIKKKGQPGETKTCAPY